MSLTLDDALGILRRHMGTRPVTIGLHVSGDVALAVEADLRERGLRTRRTLSGGCRDVSYDGAGQVRLTAYLPYGERFPDEGPTLEQQLADARAELEAVTAERDALLSQRGDGAAKTRAHVAKLALVRGDGEVA